MKKETKTLPVADGAVPVHCVRPAQPGPLLVVVPSIFGVSPDVEYYATLFAEHGALVYVLDSFWRTMPGPLPIGGDATLALKRRRETHPDDVCADILAAVEAGLSDRDCNGRAILLGICFGGRSMVRVAQSRRVDGVAVWHGSGLSQVLVPEALGQTPIVIDTGAADPMIPPSEVDKVREALAQSDAQVRVHAGAEHGFSHRGTPKYNAAAATAAEQSVLEMIASSRANDNCA